MTILNPSAFKSFEHKFKYTLAGHSGDGPDIDFLKNGKYPRNEAERFEIMKQMHNHATFCLSGDTTLPAINEAIKHVASQDNADDRFVIILSDANLAQYNILTHQISKALYSDDRVNAYIVFIGGLGDQSDGFVKGVGEKAFRCESTSSLVRIFKKILAEAVEK